MSINFGNHDKSGYTRIDSKVRIDSETNKNLILDNGIKIDSNFDTDRESKYKEEDIELELGLLGLPVEKPRKPTRVGDLSEDYSPAKLHSLEFAFRKLNRIHELRAQEDEGYQKSTKEAAELQQQSICDPSGCGITVPIYNDCQSGKLCLCGCDLESENDRCCRMCTYYSFGGWIIDGINSLVWHILCTPCIYKCDPGLPIQRKLKNRTISQHQSRIEALKKEEDPYIKLIGKLIKRYLAEGKFLELIEAQFLIALRKGNIGIPLVSTMLKNGVDPNLRDENGNTALIIAAQTSNVQAITVLLEQGADLNITVKNNDGLTAVDIAEKIKDSNESRKSIYDILLATNKMIAHFGISEYEINRALNIMRIHADDWHRYLPAIATAHRSKFVELPLVERSRCIPGFALEIIPQVTRRLALQTVRAADIPADDENRYVDLIIASHDAEVGGTHHPIAWHIESVLQQEALNAVVAADISEENQQGLVAEIIGKFKSQIAAPYNIIPVLVDIANHQIGEYFINRELDDKKMPAVDRPRYLSAMMRHYHCTPESVLRPRELAAAAFSQALREIVLETVLAGHICIADQTRYVTAIIESLTAEVEDTHLEICHPILWHFVQRYALEIVQAANIPVESQPGLIMQILYHFESRVNAALDLNPLLADIGNKIIKEYLDGVSQEAIVSIIDNCTDFMTTDIPKEPVILHDLAVWRPLNNNAVLNVGAALERAEKVATVQRHKIYSKASVKAWFRYRTTTGIPCAADTADNLIRYQNAAGNLDPNGYPIATNPKHPVFTGSILTYPETKFYDATLLLVMQMIAAAQAINQNARTAAANPHFTAYKFNRSDEQPVIIWRYLNGRNPNTGVCEIGWLIQETLNAAVTELNAFIANPYPRLHHNGATDQTLKKANYFRSLGLHRLSPLVPGDFIIANGISVTGVDRNGAIDNSKHRSERQNIVIFSSSLSSPSSRRASADPASQQCFKR